MVGQGLMPIGDPRNFKITTTAPGTIDLGVVARTLAESREANAQTYLQAEQVKAEAESKDETMKGLLIGGVIAFVLFKYVIK